MQLKRSRVMLAAGMMAAGIGSQSLPTIADDTEWAGFVEQVTHQRRDVGLSKARTGVQLEGLKFVGDVGPFSNVSVNSVFRLSYDWVYKLNDDEYGENAGGAAMLNSYGLANIGAPTTIEANGNGIGPAGGLGVGNWAVSNILGPRVDEIVAGLNGVVDGLNPDGSAYVPGTYFPWEAVLGGNTFVDSYPTNPNVGMITLGEHLHPHDGGVAFAVPVRPCNVDSRGCINDYMDADEDELASPELYGERGDWLRELYVDATVLLDGDDEINIRLGKQQVIWGRTDLFRVLDIINPVDYSRNNIYDELEDIRIPMWILKTDFRFGPTGSFDDLNAQVVWNFDKFRPNNLGQCGTPNVILDAGCFFRGMKNLWDNGGTVANFAPYDPANPSLGLLATNFGPHTIGIRDIHLPEWSLSNTQLGFKVEGVSGDFTWSVNAMTYRSQLPSLRAGGIEVVNPFTGEVRDNWDHLIAFDIYFPRVNMIGGSFDYYSQGIDTVFRVEAAYTQGEEFANTIEKTLYSENDVFRFVIGADKNVFIRSLNERRAFLLSAQLFGQQIQDHVTEKATLGTIGMPDWETNFIGTFLIKGWWMSDRLSPQLIAAHDFKAGATVVAPSVDWLIDDNWQVIFGANIKFGGSKESFDDCRLCNPFPPFTTSIPGLPEHGAAGLITGSAGISGFEPLGRFRSGPIGMAEKEDELQLTVRYRF